MKIYHQNKNKFVPRGQGRNIVKTWVFIFFVFTLIVITNKYAKNFTIKTIVISTSPVFKFTEIVSSAKKNIVFLFKNKQSLEEDIAVLKEKNAELENELILLDYIKTENEELKIMFSRPDKKSYILGSVILRPPKSPHDMIVADAGSSVGVVQGMKVIAHSNILIGYVVEVFPNSSKIKLLSFPGEEVGLMIESAKISAIGFGLGGGNIEIKIPSSVVVNVGEKIIAEGTFHYLLGIVDKVETDLINPFQKIIFRMPVNLNELQRIGIEK